MQKPIKQGKCILESKKYQCLSTNAQHQQRKKKIFSKTESENTKVNQKNKELEKIFTENLTEYDLKNEK